MSIASVFSWPFTGLIVGLIARALIHGRQRMGFLATTVVGIAGAMIGGFLYTMVHGSSVRPFELSVEAWYCWTVLMLGAMLLVSIFGQVVHAG